MARAIGYFNANPADEPGDFDEESAALQRRRAMLLSAMQTPVGGQGSGWGGAIGNFLQQAIGSQQLGGLDQRSKDLAARRASHAEKALMDLGSLDKPAVPSTPALNTGAPVAGEMGPAAPVVPATVRPALADTNETAVAAGGMVPVNDFVPGTPGSPMIPGSMADRMKLVNRLAAGGPMYQKIADKVMTQGLEAPEKEAARQAAAADAKARADADREARLTIERQRAEDRAADNARQERALQATIDNKNATLEERRAARQSLDEIRRQGLELRREALTARKDATAKEEKADEKEITRHIKDYGAMLTKEKLPELDQQLREVEGVISKYKGKDIPGVGMLSSVLPPMSKEAIEVRAPITRLRNLITKSEAGLSQTAAEMKSVLEGLGLNAFSPEQAFLEAIPRLRATLETRKQTVGSSFRPEAVEEFHRRSGASGGQAAPGGKPPLSSY